MVGAFVPFGTGFGMGVRATKIGEHVDKVGKYVGTEGAEKIAGYTKHGLNQKATRGIPTKDVLSTVRNPLGVFEQTGRLGTKNLYLSEKAGVVLNQNKQVITTYGASSFKPHISNAINQLKSGLSKLSNTLKNLKDKK